MRDFKMIDQSDMIVSLVPELADGKPGLSSGVERELHHAFEVGKEVYVIWACRATPSPFVTETATKILGAAGRRSNISEGRGMWGKSNHTENFAPRFFRSWRRTERWQRDSSWQ